MYAQIESVQNGRARLDLRGLGALVATLAVGVAAGFLAASLNAPSTTKVVSNAPAAAAAAPSTGMYGDHDSRLPIAGGVSAGIYGDHDSRLPIASGAAVSTSSVRSASGSRLLNINASDTDLQRGIDANVTALQGLAGADWSVVQDAHQQPAPFSGRRFQ